MKKIIMAIVGVMLISGGVLACPAMAASTICDEPDSVFDQTMKEAAGCFDDEKKDTTIMPVINTIINIVLSIVGIVAVCVIVYGGVTFTTSMGDARRVYMAKQTIIYGVIGLIVAMLAFVIVQFVIKAVSGA